MKRWLFGIFALALVLRIVSLDKFPVGFTPDEASFGYDAYSILHTGKDQWGTTLPIILKSFGDFKSPLYSYLTIPFVLILGLTKEAVRLPNALIGSLTVFPLWLLTGIISDLLKFTDKKKKILQISSSFLFAISSWSVMLGRGAFEANLTTFFLPLGIYLFIKAIRKNKGFIFPSLIFGLNIFTYHSAKLVTPVIFTILVILFWKEIKAAKRSFIYGLLIFLSFFTLMISTLFVGGLSRLNGISVFNGAVNQAADERYSAILKGTNLTLAKITHNKYQVSLFRFTNNYFSYFSPDFLFLKGPAETTYGMLPGRGVLYIFELPFLLGFLYLVIRKRSKPLIFIILWLLIAPIPASLAQGAGFAANRDEISIPAIQIALSFGFLEIFIFVEKFFSKRILKLGFLLYGIFSAIVFLSFLKDYFIFSPFIASKGMLYGNLEVAEWLKENTKDSDRIIVSRSLSEPHMYIAFANSWKPSDYQRNSLSWDLEEKNVNWVDQLPEYNLGNYTFTSINFNKDRLRANYIVAKTNEFPQNSIFIKVFAYPGEAENGIAVYSTQKVYAQKNN